MMAKKFNFRDLGPNPVPVEFSDPPPFVSSCIRCHSISLNMKIDPCGHVFCNFCINESRGTVYCPNTRKSISVKNLENADKITNVLGMLTVFCINKSEGCGEITDLRDLQEHLQECLIGNMTCQYCKRSLRRKNYENHLKKCLKKPWFCEDCRNDISVCVTKQEHLNTCQAHNVVCHLCNNIIPKGSFQEHLDFCKQKLCTHCDGYYSEDEIKEHEERCSQKPTSEQRPKAEHQTYQAFDGKPDNEKHPKTRKLPKTTIFPPPGSQQQTKEKGRICSGKTLLTVIVSVTLLAAIAYLILQWSTKSEKAAIDDQIRTFIQLEIKKGIEMETKYWKKEMEIKVADQNEFLTKLQSQLEIFKNEMTSLVSDKLTAMQDSFDQLEHRLGKRLDDVESRTNKIAEETESSRKVQDESIKQLRNYLQSLEEAQNSSNTEIETKQTEFDFKGTINRLKAKVTATEENVKKNDELISSLTTKVDNVEGTINRLKARVIATEENVKRIEKLEEDVKSMSAKVDKDQKRIEKLEEDVKSMSSNVKKDQKAEEEPNGTPMKEDSKYEGAGILIFYFSFVLISLVVVLGIGYHEVRKYLNKKHD